MDKYDLARFLTEKNSNEANYDRLMNSEDKLIHANNDIRRLKEVIRMIQEEITVTVEDNHYRQLLLDRIAHEMNGIKLMSRTV